MKNCFVMTQKNTKIKLTQKMNSNSNTWTCWDPGDGELEICDQGWLEDSSFSQETESTVQRRGFGSRPIKSEVQDARTTLTHLPLFFLLKKDKQLMRISQ